MKEVKEVETKEYSHPTVFDSQYGSRQVLDLLSEKWTALFAREKQSSAFLISIMKPGTAVSLGLHRHSLLVWSPGGTRRDVRNSVSHWIALAAKTSTICS